MDTALIRDLEGSAITIPLIRLVKKAERLCITIPVYRAMAPSARNAFRSSLLHLPASSCHDAAQTGHGREKARLSRQPRRAGQTSYPTQLCISKVCQCPCAKKKGFMYIQC
ncbi:hypothetical protein LMH87_000792 [Akanthomyces muscarius]|uniref:Uncharacterized protein n=1 Tax=Akanthomyces muscarius TaxID=2231603 RepID=A0A9W8ULF5_AKAMU|nr:hypothetical protein LMH87_000792 [Akanthomyces muscarius]KAJ4155553.1 hypothetical protein LMH87_000792 [Akanthomyces muscarius]